MGNNKEETTQRTQQRAPLERPPPFSSKLLYLHEHTRSKLETMPAHVYCKPHSIDACGVSVCGRMLWKERRLTVSLQCEMIFFVSFLSSDMCAPSIFS